MAYKKKEKDSKFAEVQLTGEEFNKNQYEPQRRIRPVKLVYPNDVMLILHSDISVAQLEQFLRKSYRLWPEFVNYMHKLFIQRRVI